MYIKVKVRTGDRSESIKKLSNDTFQISVKEKAERNQANVRVFELISQYLGVDKSKIKIISGHRRSNKIFLIE